MRRRVLLVAVLLLGLGGVFSWSRLRSTQHLPPSESPGQRESTPASSARETISAAGGSGTQSNPDASTYRRLQPLAAGAVTEDWPNFLGPRFDSVSRETKLLKTWPKEGPARVWEVKKGTGYSAPAILGERLILFHRQGDHEVVDCLHAETGARFWQFRYPSHYQDRFGYNNGPRSSPVIGANHVLTCGAAGQLHCLNLETGALHWAHDLLNEYGLTQNFFGLGSTPLLDSGLVIVNVGAPKSHCVVAFNLQDGKEVWGSGDSWGPSYASPVPAEIHGKRRVLIFAGGESRPPSGGLLCLDPATGAIDFQFPWRSSSFESVNAACPVVAGNLVFVTASYETGGALIEIGADFRHRVRWTTQELGSHFSTVIHRSGYLYGFDGRHDSNAELTCLDIKSGKCVWRGSPTWEEGDGSRIAEEGRQMSPGRGALLWTEQGVLCLGEFGHLLWLELSPQGCRELARAWLFRAPETWTPPVLSRGLLYIAQNHRGREARDEPKLICYDLRALE